MERTVERGDSSSFFFFNEGENGRERRAGTHDQPQTKKERKKENDNDWFTSKQRQQYQQQQRKNGEGIRLMQRADLVACSCGGGNALRREQCCVRVCAFSFFCVCFPPLVLGRRCACSHFFFFLKIFLSGDVIALDGGVRCQTLEKVERRQGQGQGQGQRERGG
jgi:hypothetical protein